jgi:uncharacterized protein (TIGR00251 family)
MAGSPIEPIEGGCVIHVYAAPRASRTQVVGVHDGMLKIQIAAPPVDGAANEALMAFLALSLQVPKKAVRLTSGASNKRKTLHIDGISSAQACAAFGLLDLSAL